MALSEEFEGVIKKIEDIRRDCKRLDNHYAAPQYYSDKEKLVSRAFLMIREKHDLKEAYEMGKKLVSVLRAAIAGAA